ncbi:hypothetical protein CLOM_g17837 [Closterium sp. NIES-68]|nr:hypothetical protein CLOM_g17837 [Closterium sp. NIES-68]
MKLHPCKRNYPIHDKEMLAIVLAFKIWQCYLTCMDMAVQTDHCIVQYIRTQPLLNPRQICWLEFTKSNFYYTVTYRKNASNLANPFAHLTSIILAQAFLLLTGLPMGTRTTNS